MLGPAPMIAALQRLVRYRDARAELPKNLAAFGIRTGEREGLGRLLMSHPPLEARIAALSTGSR